MPTSFLTADTSFPRLTEEMPVREQLSRVENYLFILLEQLRYTLSNLSADNFNDAALKEIGEAISAPMISVVTDLAGNVSTLGKYVRNAAMQCSRSYSGKMSSRELKSRWTCESCFGTNSRIARSPSALSICAT